jgi:Flp pilus assembly protein TadD
VLYRDLGNLLGQAEALNRLGELSSQTSATTQARKRHTQALTIAHDLSAVPEEARTLEGLGQAHLQDGNPGQATAHLSRRSRSTNASDPPAPSASAIPCTNMD